MPRVNIGRYISKLRIERGLSQRELADKIGIKQPPLSRIERGVSYPKLSTIRNLCCVLGLNFDDFPGFAHQSVEESRMDKLLVAYRKLYAFSDCGNGHNFEEYIKVLDELEMLGEKAHAQKVWDLYKNSIKDS